jgi:hypothetical protein
MMTDRADKRGKLTRARGALLSAVGRGATISAACKAAGITRTTFYRWKELAAAGKAEHLALFADIEQAEAQAQIVVESALVTAAESGDVRAMLGYLERRDPDNWARPDVRSETVRKLRQVVGAAVQRMSNQAGQEMIAAFAEEAGLDITEINGAGSLGSGSGQK